MMMPCDIANTLNNYFASLAQNYKKHKTFTQIFQFIFQMKVVVQYFCKLY